MNSLLIVLSNPISGREDDYNVVTGAEHQMLAPHPLRGWEALDRQTPVFWSTHRSVVACHEPVMQRLPAEEVRNPDPDSPENATRARRALGNRVYTALPFQLQNDVERASQAQDCVTGTRKGGT